MRHIFLLLKSFCIYLECENSIKIFSSLGILYVEVLLNEHYN